MANVSNYLYWDNDNDPNSNPLFPKKLRCIISGSSGCGKTVLLTNMILNQWLDFKRLIIVSGSMFQPIYQVLMHGFLNKIPPQILKNIFLQKDDIIQHNKSIKEICTLLGQDLTPKERYNIDVEAYEDAKNLPDVIEIPKDTLVIFDDLMTDRNAQKKAGELFTKGRPHGINVIFITQSYYEIPKRTIRDNANFIILFRQNTRSIEPIHRDNVNSTDMGYKEFLTFVNSVWKERHSFVTIDKTLDAHEGKFRKNLDTFYIPQQHSYLL